MSPLGLVGSDALSTAFRPFTLVAPPFDVLIRSQPRRSGWQLTEGTGKEGAWVKRPRSAAETLMGRGSGSGMACARSGAPDR